MKFIKLYLIRLGIFSIGLWPLLSYMELVMEVDSSRFNWLVSLGFIVLLVFYSLMAEKGYKYGNKKDED